MAHTLSAVALTRRVATLAATLVLLAAGSGPAAAASHTAEAPAPPAATTPAAPKVSPYHGTKMTQNGRRYYLSAWGVDGLKVSYTSSGNLIRLSYRVVEPKKAAPLGDKRSTPYLYGQRSHAMLQIPVMEKIGQLRQTGELKAGQDYWMVFSNKGNLVRRGDRVDVIIGTFHADGLVVE